MDYKTIGQNIQIKGNKGKINPIFVQNEGFEMPQNPTRIQAIELFNDIAEENGLNRLRDPLGYMKLDNNMYDAIHETYKAKYQQTADMIDNGLMTGGSYGMKAVLNKLNPTVRKDMKTFMPQGVKYSELRFIENTPQSQELIDKYVAERVRLTYSWGIKRSVEKSTFDSILNNMQETGKQLTHQINIGLGLEEDKKVLSRQTLLDNSKNNTQGLQNFMTQLKDPDEINKIDDNPAIASFSTRDMPTAKFLLQNKKYLEQFDFNIKKGKGVVNVQWSSPKVEKLYEERNIGLNFEGLEDELQQ